MLKQGVNVYIPTDDIYHLQIKYNTIVESITHQESSPLSDPIEALPLELWTAIIKLVVDEGGHIDGLLTLTMVSQRWCRLLVALPVLWTSIQLDPSYEDYLAKAALCLSLSQSNELDVSIHASLGMWEESAGLISMQSARIRSLRLHVPATSDAFRILKDFPSLPILKNVHLTSDHGTPVSTDDLLAVNRGTLPMLQTITGLLPMPRDRSWARFITCQFIAVRIIQQDVLEAWANMPNLRTLNIVEFSRDAGSFTAFPKAFDSSLLRVRELNYNGIAVDRVLTWIGLELVDLDLITPTICNLRQLSHLIQRFDRMEKLSLDISSDRNGLFNHSITTTALKSLPSIKELSLYMEGIDWEGPNEHFVTLLEDFYQSLVSILPGVEKFSMFDGPVTIEGTRYVASLRGLKTLNFVGCGIYHKGDIRCTASQVRFVTECLEGLRWSGGAGLLTLLRDFEIPNLRLLQRSNRPENTLAEIEDGNDKDPMDIFRLRRPEESYPYLTHLTIFVEGSFYWDLGSHSGLRELEIRAPHPNLASLLCASDIMEFILLNPGSLPSLEKINLRNEFIEWDILILMLERRNIHAQPGISPIKAITVDQQLPYRLLYPLTSLLRGKFPERGSILSFSTEAISERIWNESL